MTEPPAPVPAVPPASTSPEPPGTFPGPVDPPPSTNPEPEFATLARSFDRVAAQYAAARPDYPPALLDAVEELAGRPLRDARVVDVGAGTGIATRLLLGRGAEVVAVEPGDGMSAQLRAGLPAVPLLRGDGNALPLRDAVADFVTYAQSWHWTDPARSVPEALRVLRPGGALAMWWNVPDPDVAWTVAQENRFRARFPTYYRHDISTSAPVTLASLGATPQTRRLRWARRVPLDTHLAMLGSRSYFAALGAARTAAFLGAERELLLAQFPDGWVEEPYALHLIVTLR
jgi:SAM-dependent methyltransferase